MKQISAETNEIWRSGDYTGPNRRPYARVTIQKMHMQRVDYTLPPGTWQEWNHHGRFATALFGQDVKPRELYNVQTVKYDRATDSDAATCTITLSNTRIQAPDQVAPNDDDFDQPGFYTPNRGDGDFFMDRWGYEANWWHDWLLPDRLIRTYEGYGLNPLLAPEEDEHMYPSGVWLIDKVTMTPSGEMQVVCRDLAKLLLDQMLYPPIVPRGVYPLWFEKFTEADNQPTYNIDDEFVPNFDTSSNVFYDGAPGLDPDQEVNPGGDVLAHSGDDAFDSNVTTWWMSNGQRHNGWAWVQGSMSARTVQSFRLNVVGGPYRVFVSLWNGTSWIGAHKIPYRVQDLVDIEAGIRYVSEFTVASGESVSYLLPNSHPGITRIRFTFTDLWDAGIEEGSKYPCRAAVQEIVVGDSASLLTATGTHYDGNYADYTDVVKWLLAWSGFYWPRVGSGLAWVKYRGSDTHHPRYQEADDPVLFKGRVWGDFMPTGTSGVVKLPVETFDKKPVMDGINAIREIIGFEFWVDETGAAVWRLANMYRKGNYLMPALGQSRSTHTTDVIVIDENDTLMDIAVDLDSSNVRERVFVGNVGGKFGYTVKGFNPAPSGMQRVGGWTDQNFESEAECQRMAEMIALRQAMTYRTARITIPGNPAIQIDDQIRLYERQTGEGYLHRITAISSSYDTKEGSWTYDLTTHWLGDEPFTDWAFDPAGMSAGTRDFLRAVGALDGQNEVGGSTGGGGTVGGGPSLPGDGGSDGGGAPDGGVIIPAEPGGGLVHATTLIGQSYDNYKKLSLGSAYVSVEGDTAFGGDQGSGVSRRYSPGAIRTWSFTVAQIRAGQPVIYSWKTFGTNIATGKQEVRDWLDSKPPTSAHCFLVYFHECDDDIRQGGKQIPGATAADRLDWWAARHQAVREVLSEPAYADRTDVSFGNIYTGVPYSEHTASNDRWEHYYDVVGEGIWNFQGVDHYNPAWDGANRYMPVSNWINPVIDMANQTGLNWLIGEGGSPLASRTNGQTDRQRKQERASWLADILEATLDDGRCEAWAYWRRPALVGESNPFSTLMFTPPGFNATYDDEWTCAVFNEAAVNSVTVAGTSRF